MKPIKYSIFYLLSVALYTSLLLIYGNLLYYSFSNIRNPGFLIPTIVFGGGLMVVLISLALGTILEKVKMVKMNPYDQKGLNIVLFSFFVIGILFLIINWLNLDFQYTRGYFLFLLMIFTCYASFYPFLPVFTGEKML